MRSHTKSYPLWPFFVALALSALGLNWFWEMAHMRAYVEMLDRPWQETTFLCALASLGDLLVTLGICGVGSLAAGRLDWGRAGRWNVYATAALLGGACATAIEWKALAAGYWSYTSRMPLVPLLGVGLSPLLQLTLLVPAALGVATWWDRRYRRTEMAPPVPTAENGQAGCAS